MTSLIKAVLNNDDSMSISYDNGETLFRFDACDNAITYSFSFLNGVLVSTILDNEYRRIF